MDYRKLAEQIGHRFEVEWEFNVIIPPDPPYRKTNWNDYISLAVFQTQPMTTGLYFRKPYDGIQWFEIQTVVGRILDPSSFSATDLLAENYSRDGIFAIMQLESVPLLVLRDRYALREDMEEKDVFDILCIRISGPLMFNLEIPGVGPY